MTTLTKQTKAAWEALKKQFLREKNGKITRQVHYFQGGKAGWFLIEGKHSIYLGKNQGLAYNKLLTLNPKKSIESNDLLRHKSGISVINLAPSNKRKSGFKWVEKTDLAKEQNEERWEWTEPIETTELDDFEIRLLVGTL